MKPLLLLFALLSPQNSTLFLELMFKRHIYTLLLQHHCHISHIIMSPRKYNRRSYFFTHSAFPPPIKNHIKNTALVINRIKNLIKKIEIVLHRMRILSQSCRLNPSALIVLFCQTGHFFYLHNDASTVALPYAVWNLVIKHSVRPAQVLIICQDHITAINLIQSNRLNRPFLLINEQITPEEFISILQDSKYQVTIITQTKLSMLLAQLIPSKKQSQEDYLKEHFELIIAYSMCFDPQYYIKLCEILIPNGTIVLFCTKSTQANKIGKKLQLQIKQTTSSLTSHQTNKQLLSSIQFQTKPTSQLYELVSLLPFSKQESAARLFSLQLARMKPPHSLYLQMTGYVTYNLSLDVQFLSLKYAWNFLNEELPENFLENVRGMQKYQNQKGVVFNVPQDKTHIINYLSQKICNNKKKYKGITLEQAVVIPPLEDVNSLEYKIIKEKKQFAMDHKQELQIFIGGVPYDYTQELVRKFFQTNNVNLFMVRTLKDKDGISKGIAFALCQDKQHFQKAINLNGVKIRDQSLRIKLANQKHRDEK